MFRLFVQQSFSTDLVTLYAAGPILREINVVVLI